MKLSVNVQCFPGFYESWLSGGIDNAEEGNIEGITERQEEDGVPLELRLDVNQMSEIYWRVYPCDYRKVEEDICKQFVDAMNTYVSGEGDFDLQMEFEEMTSPKEYNFTTDRLFVKMELDVLAEMMDRTTPKTLCDTIREQFTPRSGFIPFYSNDPKEWMCKPLEDWDHNELGTLLSAFLADNVGVGEMVSAICMYHIEYSGPVDEHTDWSKFDEAVEEKRDEMREELGEAPLTPAPCKHTGDLFDRFDLKGTETGRWSSAAPKDPYFKGDE